MGKYLWKIFEKRKRLEEIVLFLSSNNGRTQHKISKKILYKKSINNNYTNNNNMVSHKPYVSEIELNRSLNALRDIFEMNGLTKEQSADKIEKMRKDEKEREISPKEEARIEIERINNILDEALTEEDIKIIVEKIRSLNNETWTKISQRYE